jgi:epoxide hydrolase-like predicted phosphatase
MVQDTRGGRVVLRWEFRFHSTKDAATMTTTGSPVPRAGIFDFGGVMAVSPISRMLWLADTLGTTPQVVFDTIFGGLGDGTDNPWHEAERGRLDLGEEFGQRMQARFAPLGVTFDLAVFHHWVAGAFNTPEPDMVAVVRDLREAGIPTVLLTNSVREFRPVIEATIPVAELFDAVVDSCEVGMRKPEPGIYHLAAERAGVPIEQCLFLDDHLGNVEGALGQGLPALHVTDVAAAAAEVRRRFALD